MLPFHRPQRRLQKGKERQAQPFQFLQGRAWGWGWWQPCCWAACQALLLQPAQRYKPGSVSPCVQESPNRAKDSKANSATLLKAMQTQLNCENNARLVIDKHTEFENFAGQAQVLPHNLYV